MQGYKNPTRRGVSRADVICSLVAGTFVLSTAMSMSLSVDEAAGIAVSHSNLIQISQAHEMFAADRDGRVFTTHRDDYGLYGNNCASYIKNAGCPDQVLLGWSGDCNTDCSDGLWGYWLDVRNICAGFGSCASWVVHQPIDFDAKFGSFRLSNIMRLNEYLNGRFYDPVFYAPLDTLTYRKAAPLMDGCCGFEYDGTIAWSSYSFSPAGMFDSGVMRANADGGFQSPGSYDDSHKIPRLTEALYPSLKTLIFEHNWNHGQPAAFNPNFSGQRPFQFNHGRDARPLTCFVDGSVRMLPSGVVESDDARVSSESGGVDGLWHRNTPLGFSGYYGAQSWDGLRVAHNILTTDGIRGRDVLSTSVRSPDIDGDGVVGGNDLSKLLGAWGQDRSWDSPTDLTADGQTDGQDLLGVLSHWNSP